MSKSNPFEYLREVTEYDIAVYYSPVQIKRLLIEMLEEIDRGLRVEEEYRKLADSSLRDARENSVNMLKAVLAGTQVEKKPEDRDPQIVAFVEGKSKTI